ncbi:hypothetical protein Bhyg_16050 [Pseudolycoriella hygida]|uniref:Methyltransferase domain-containing protein n=1 Tax=Pseudolycoriella hygida TaxID=35572 RepID=A0A9Q0RUT5_9DIPT|nr:hypothetical protein Bhyg_16050 [Pseudolycoriella hygida]
MLLEVMCSAGLILLITAVAMKFFRSKIYNVLIVHLTSQWYREVLDLVSKNSKILDVGIGTGQALIKNKSLLVQKNIKVDGVDYDLDYVNQCRAHIQKERLQNYITVCHKSIFDYVGGPYDVIYFSASLMILPNPVTALNHVKSILRENGKIFITQTIESNRSHFMELVKPLLKYVLTIDFGSVTYEDDLMATFKEANLKVHLNKTISGTSANDKRSYRLFVLERIQ